LEGLKKEFAGATIQYVPGTKFLTKDADPVPAALLTIDGKPGVKASYSKEDLTVAGGSKPAPLVTRIEKDIDTVSLPLPAEVADVNPLAIHWETTLTPAESGEYNLGVRGDGFMTLKLNGKRVINTWDTYGEDTELGRVSLEKGKPYQVKLDYSSNGKPISKVQLVWEKLDYTLDQAAIEAAKNADVVVAVVGITSELEGEEMDVDLPGFKGGDRTSLDLPKPEEDLLEAVAATGKPLVVVLTNGSALGVNWAKDHANAILDAWYPGEEGGAAVAETLSGRNNPAGRLPVTFYKDVSQLPPFDDYSMKDRTYRYFEGTPLYPFGYGLSYTTFAYSGLIVPTAPVAAGSPVVVEATVTNTGKRAGDEVAQLYLSFPDVPGRPLRALRGFQRVHLEPGASQKLHFELQPRDLSMVTEAGEPIVAEGTYAISVGGNQPYVGVPVLMRPFEIKGTLNLPE
jgi:beta-glucosidase